MTEGLQCNKDLLGTTATKWSPTVAAATATCSSRFGFFAQTRIQKNFIRCFVPIHFLCLFGRVVCFVVMSLPRLNRKPSVQLCQHVYGKSFGILEGQERVQAAP